MSMSHFVVSACHSPSSRRCFVPRYVVYLFDNVYVLTECRLSSQVLALRNACRRWRCVCGCVCESWVKECEEWEVACERCESVSSVTYRLYCIVSNVSFVCIGCNALLCINCRALPCGMCNVSCIIVREWECDHESVACIAYPLSHIGYYHVTCIVLSYITYCLLLWRSKGEWEGVSVNACDLWHVRWCDVMWCEGRGGEVRWCDMMWCDVMCCDVMCCGVMWCIVL